MNGPCKDHYSTIQLLLFHILFDFFLCKLATTVLQAVSDKTRFLCNTDYPERALRIIHSGQHRQSIGRFLIRLTTL